ncbi:MAG: helix-turn-helix domain-containing protein [Sulfuricella denitrificans]|nr:helix-turn-helix domain-containing protein [Sulfuricella denitrificans]
MTHSTSVVSMGQIESETDMFADLEPLTAFEVKRDYVATQLTALMSHCGKSRSVMAEELGWKKSRITKVLSGRNNLTLKTICEFSTHLGYDFDVVFHGVNEPRPKQPWQIQNVETTSLPMEALRMLSLPTKAQSALEVAIDLLQGNGKEFYYGVDSGGFNTVPLSLPSPSRTFFTSTEFNTPLSFKLRKCNEQT